MCYAVGWPSVLTAWPVCARVQSGVGIIFERDSNDSGPLVVKGFVPHGVAEASGEVSE